MPVQMARNKRDRDHSTFRPEDEIDELFAGANPNPRRVGCPGFEVLRAAARRKLPMQHEAYGHLSECSECYREFGAYRESRRRLLSIRAALAAAAIVAVVIGGAYLVRSLGVSRWSGGPVAIVLDYRDESVTRSEAGDPIRSPKSLPRANVAATIFPPAGSEPGEYEVRLVDGSGQVRFGRSAVARMEDFAVRFKVSLDLQSVPRGAYSLEIHRVGEDWDPHPVVIR
ncbi:MAG: hypothetical protein KJZ78_01950 [Bryobacteraceae bacterium]|nr:hypothetical protein [Bryobacteraceae bacterium]